MISDLVHIFQPALIHGIEYAHVFQYGKVAVIQYKFGSFICCLQFPPDYRIKISAAIARAGLP